MAVTISALTAQLILASGDLFQSSAQTLTVAVNTVGVMGKGQALQARQRFPALYPVYREWCQQGALRIGVPRIYRQAADSAPWLLLFPIKSHWRQTSDLAGIAAGLQWLVDHAEEAGIESLALPALGCGLGQLAWSAVGPLMCRYLKQLPFPIALYVPHEHQPPEEQLTADFLL